jgi:hypothetical protein
MVPDVGRPPTARAYAVAVLGPGALMFFLPLLYSRIPMHMHLPDWTALVGGADTLRAVTVATVWFGTAFSILLWRTGGASAPARLWTPQVAWKVLVVTSTGGLAVAVVHEFWRLPAYLEEFTHQLGFLPVVGMIIGFWLLRETRSKKLPSHRAGWVWIMVFCDMAAALGLPLLLSRAVPIATGLIALLYGAAAAGLMRRGSYLVIATALAVVLLAIPVRQFLRVSVYHFHVYNRPFLLASPKFFSKHPSQAFSGSFHEVEQSAGQLQRQAAHFDPAADGLRLPKVGGPLGLLEYEFANALDRLNRLSDLGYVVSLTPRHVPYLGLETYLPLEGTLIPRILWPDKPTDASGVVYAYRYGLLPPDALARQTYNVPIVTEGWMDAGWWGVLGSALLFGLLLRFAFHFWIGSHGELGNVVIGMAVVAAAADNESGLSLTLGGVVHALVVYWCIDVLVRAYQKHMTAASPGPMVSPVEI